MWKIYFWLIIGLQLLDIGVVILANNVVHHNVNYNNINHFETNISFFSATYDVLMGLIQLFSLLGLYAYVYKKKFLSKETWKFIFFLILIDSVGEILYLSLEKNYLLIGIMTIFIPYFYALYKYAFVNENLEV